MKKTGFAPVFEKDSNRFIFRFTDAVGETEEEAREIGFGLAFMEGILTRSKYTGEIVDVEHLRNLEADLGGYEIAIISGPLFDEAEGKTEAENEPST